MNDSCTCDGHFGCCPICKSDYEPEYLNVSRSHFFICRKHKVAWWVGANLFSSWMDDSDHDWERNRELLSREYRPVESWHCDVCHRQAAERSKSVEPVDELPF